MVFTHLLILFPTMFGLGTRSQDTDFGSFITEADWRCGDTVHPLSAVSDNDRIGQNEEFLGLMEGFECSAQRKMAGIMKS